MKNVFLKPGFEKTTKSQSKLRVPENVLDNLSASEVVEGQAEIVPFELFTERLNPLTDFCRENIKEVKFVFITEKNENPIYLDVTNLKHYIVVVEAGCSGAVVFDGEGKCLASAEIYVQKNASLKVVLLQLGCSEFNFSAFRTSIEESAKIDWFLNYFNLNNGYSFVQNHIVGFEGEANINLVSSSVEKDVTDFFAGNCFDAKNCKGQILAKAVSKDFSRMSFVGEIEITLNGGGTDSYLKEDVLMLDETSKIDAVPSLEIKTNDVKAGHGVSISKLNEDKLFYLTSRAISTDEARKLVLSGFLRDMFTQIGIEDVVERLNLIIA
jgi:Fe-S cluster assembly scaffold protein SufB